MSTTTWKSFDLPLPINQSWSSLKHSCCFCGKSARLKNPADSSHLCFFIGSLSSNRWTCTEMLSGMKAMTGPICRAGNFYIQKNIITYLFILQMRKYFMQRIEQKWTENWTSLFCGKLDFWRGRSDTAAPCGHGFHNHHIMCHLWPLQVTYDRATYGNTPYDQSLQPFLVEVGRIWKHRSISSIIISW